jgi:integrase
LGPANLEDGTPQEKIEKWWRTLKVANRTIVRYLTVMHSVFRHARVGDNPASAENITYPKVKYSGEFVAYDREEIDALAAAAEKGDKALFLVAPLTGLRLGELQALRWRDVVDALAKLKERGYLADDDDLVFPSPTGGHIDSWALRRRFYRAIRKAGLRRIRFHDLRHTFGTTGARVLSLSDLQHYMGHAHAVTTARYIHHQPRPEDAAKLADAFRVPNRVPNGDTSTRADSNSKAENPL